MSSPHIPHLLIVAHGSRRAASNQEIQHLVDRLLASQTQFASISCGFLELAEPSIPDALRQLIAQGAQYVVIMPYFLSAGRHVSEDIPAEIVAVAEDHPEVKIVIAEYLGAANEIDQVLLSQANKSLA
jgi:sirohydrochlorin ferrochelatase